jgi:hypothetical protein
MSAARSLAVHYNVSHPHHVDEATVRAALDTHMSPLFRELIWDAEPETMIELQIETAMDWQTFKSKIRDILPETHSLSVWIREQGT